MGFTEHILGKSRIRCGFNRYISYSAVDRLMSQDIQRFLGVGEKKVHRATNPRELVLPSPFLAPVPVNTSWTNPSMNNLIPPFGPSKPVRTGYDIQSGEEEPYPDFLRRSLALDPSTYTGNAELRGEIALTPTQNVCTKRPFHGSNKTLTVEVSIDYNQSLKYHVNVISTTSRRRFWFHRQ